MQTKPRASRQTARAPQGEKPFSLSLHVTMTGFATHAFLAVCAADNATPRVTDNILADLEAAVSNTEKGAPMPGFVKCEVLP